MMNKEETMAKKQIYFNLTFVVLAIGIFSIICSKQPKDASVQLEVHKQIATIQGKPDTLRELQQDEGGYYIEDDCFCSRRILIIDTANKKLQVYSWCAFQNSPEKLADLGIYDLSRSISDTLIFERNPKQAENPNNCIAITTQKKDTMIVFTPCDKSSKSIFIKTGLTQGYQKRVQDCADIEG
jgi:hypothetical protein